MPDEDAVGSSVMEWWIRKGSLFCLASCFAMFVNHAKDNEDLNITFKECV